jgi:hypothetical protein
MSRSPISTLGLLSVPSVGVGINKEMVLADDLQRELEFGPGDEVFFMGRYVDIDGKEHNEPVLRSGMVAGFPSAPIHQAKRAHYQQTILVEARSLSGFSGSPVFVWSPHQLQRTQEGIPVANVVLGPQCYLLGIDYGHHRWREPVRSGQAKGDPVPDLFVEGNSGMMLVVPAQKVLDVLAVDALASARAVRETQERHARAHPVAVLDSATPMMSSDRFEDLTRRLVQAPKPESERGEA